MTRIANRPVRLVGVWCMGWANWWSVRSTITPRKVGFEMIGGSGKSDFITAYGGLEFAIALRLPATRIRSVTVTYGLWSTLLLHGSLVPSRTISFFVPSEIGSYLWAGHRIIGDLSPELGVAPPL